MFRKEEISAYSGSKEAGFGTFPADQRLPHRKDPDDVCCSRMSLL